MKQLCLLLALLSGLSCQAQRYITLYGQRLDAYAILGYGKEWGPAGATTRTVLITAPVVGTELNQLLGTYYSTSNFNEATDLLNILTGDREPILDSINFAFYRTSAFLNTLDRNTILIADPKYTVFKKSFLAARTNAAKRNILFDDANRKYREALEQARYTVYQKSIDINAFTQLSNNFKAGLGADASTSIIKIPGVRASAKLEAEIKRIVDRSVTMTGAKYHEIKLQPAYVNTASNVLKYYDNHRDQIEGSSLFANNLRQFLDSTQYAITAGGAVIESTFTTTSMKDLKTAIGAAVKANLVNPLAANADTIAAHAGLEFERKSLKKLGVQTGQSFYTIRLVYAKSLEIGAR